MMVEPFEQGTGRDGRGGRARDAACWAAGLTDGAYDGSSAGSWDARPELS